MFLNLRAVALFKWVTELRQKSRSNVGTHFTVFSGKILTELHKFGTFKWHVFVYAYESKAYANKVMGRARKKVEKHCFTTRDIDQRFL